MFYIEEAKKKNNGWKKKDKQWSTKHYTENLRLRNMNPTVNQARTQVLWKGKPFMLHLWHLLD
jgi:hypothetical protein